jgi:hypothetical protein
MGYTTDFEGQILVVPPMSEKTHTFLTQFADTRRMERKKGPHYVGNDHEDVTNSNRPPAGQPSLWCQWVPSDCGSAIEWDGGEKFYSSDEWMKYIIEQYLAPAGHICNGMIEAQGEDPNDRWQLHVVDNVVSVSEGSIIYSDRVAV